MSDYREQWIRAARNEPRFILRGTPEWDDRELERRAALKHCICFGPIPVNQALGEKLEYKKKVRSWI